MKLWIHKIPNTQIIFIKQEQPATFFISAQNGILISVEMLLSILTFLVKMGIIPIARIEGLLEDCKEY
ncbi:MAG: hypothetical protein ACK44H_10620 [Candidatus Kryptonium sp.]